MPVGGPIPNSAGMAQPDNAVMAGAAQMAKAAKMAAKAGGAGTAGGLGGFGRTATPSGGGEIVISRAEAAALTVFETEDDQTTAYRRAAEESGLSRSQIQRLKARADSARGKGFLLKGGNIVLRPRADGGTDERGLVWHTQKEKDEEDSLSKAERDKMTKEERLAFARSAKKVKADAAVDDAADEVKRKATAKVKKDLEETDADLEEVWSDAARVAAAAARKARGKLSKVVPSDTPAIRDAVKRGRLEAGRRAAVRAFARSKAGQGALKKSFRSAPVGSRAKAKFNRLLPGVGTKGVRKAYSKMLGRSAYLPGDKGVNYSSGVRPASAWRTRVHEGGK